MSLILEALKKSEAKRRLGDAPDLGTPFMTARRRRSAFPYLLLIIVAAALGGWWFLHPKPPQPSAPTPSGSKQAVKIATEHRDVRGVSRRPVTAANNSKSGNQQIWVAAQRANGAMNEPRHPSNAERRTATASNIEPRSRAAADAAQSGPAAPYASAMHTAQAAAARQTPASQNPASVSAHAVTRGSATETPKSTVSAATQDKLPPGVPMYYELPYNIRQALPDLKLSMHVYSKDPAQRFVILNNSRMVEGDKTSDNLSLVAIRPDGVILEYQGQRFFLPRDGF